MAVTFSWVVILMLLEPIPLRNCYTVWGRPDIPEIVYDFVHLGRLTTFTLWCNTLGCCYYWLAAVVGILKHQSVTVPLPLARSLEVLWGIIFPMSFLVNIVVSFVIIQGMKKANKYDRLWCILRWRPQVLHNGFVIAAALEAIVVGPCLHLRDFPLLILYGSSYVVFAWLLFKHVGTYHYFFMDPRFQWAPYALVALLLLLSVLYVVGFYALEFASQKVVLKILIVLAALATCTFRDKEARAPDEQHRAQGG